MESALLSGLQPARPARVWLYRLKIRLRSWLGLTWLTPQESSMNHLSYENFGREDCYLDFRGDDFLLFIRREPSCNVQYTIAKALVFGLKLQIKASEFFNPNELCKLSVSLDWENNAQWRKIINAYYLIGPVINTAQTLMSFSDSGHFFISDRVYFELDLHGLTRIDNDSVKIEFTNLPGTINPPPDSACRWPNIVHWWPSQLQDKECIFKQLTFYDAEKLKYKLHSLHAPGLNIGSANIPNYRVSIEYRDRRQLTDPMQLFIQHLVKADEVVIIGLTHENTARYLQEAIKIRREENKDFWNRLVIIFPSRSILEKIFDQHQKSLDRITKWQSGKLTITQFLRNQNLDYVNRWQCKEFDGNLPFIANRFISNVNRSIRFSPQLPGCDQKNSCYIEVFEGMPVYDEINKAVNLILTQSVSINEWVIYGQLELDDGEEKFKYHGIINRNKMEEVKSYWFPIILILLYKKTDNGFKSILQERTIYNASSDIGFFSNISGRITDFDIYAASDSSIKNRDYDEKCSDKIATKKFNSQVGLSQGNLLPNNTWEFAAVRELQEELGLTIDINRIKFHRIVPLKRADGFNSLFKIFSLELRADDSNELIMINEFRPYAKLNNSGFTLSQLEEYIVPLIVIHTL